MTERFESVGAALDFAIANEVEANAFYLELAGRMVTRGDPLFPRPDLR